jgi:type I restriction enzyme S subunit
MVESILQGFDIWTDAKGLKSKGRVISIDNISLEGIARLRELILEFAIRGRIVVQEPTDESASTLLEKIVDEKSKLIKDKKIKLENNIPVLRDNLLKFKSSSKGLANRRYSIL